MPTSSQAMIVMTEEGEDPRIPRRHIPTFSTLPFMQTSRTIICPNGSVHSSSGFPDVVDVGGYRGKMIYDTKTQSLRWMVTTQGLNNSRMLVTTKKLNVTETEVQERNQTHLENLGFRRKQTTYHEGQKKPDDIKKVVSTLPKDAKYMPTPPGVTPKPLPPIIIPTANQESYGDGNSVAEKPKSLLDELKESVSYDRRLFPSMELKKTVPSPSPSSVVFSLRNNEDYEHKDIKELIEKQTTLKAVSVQYDPVNVRVGSSSIPSRWIVQFKNPEDARIIVQNGIEISNEKVVVRFLDTVYKMEYQAYLLKEEEERKERERKPVVHVPRNRRRNRVSVKPAVRVL